MSPRIYFAIPFYILLFGFVFSGNAYPDVENSNIISGLRTKYGNARGWQAKYEREAISKTMALLGEADRHDVAKGNLYFKPPHFLRLEQALPQKELLITDGHVVWWYIPQKKEAYKYPASKFGQELSLISNILKGMDSEDKFQIAIKETPETGNHHIILKKNPPWQEIDHLEMILSKKDYSIKQLDIYNSIGGLTSFLLSNWKEVQPKADFFTFSPPAGVKIIEN